MPTFAVIKDFDIFKDRTPRLFSCFVTLVIDVFAV